MRVTFLILSEDNHRQFRQLSSHSYSVSRDLPEQSKRETERSAETQGEVSREIERGQQRDREVSRDRERRRRK
jgi:hypothetical protein